MRFLNRFLLNENALYSLFAKNTQSGITEQSKACNVFCEHHLLCYTIGLLLMRNHTEVNALLLCKRLDMLERHNGGHGRRRL